MGDDCADVKLWTDEASKIFAPHGLMSRKAEFALIHPIRHHSYDGYKRDLLNLPASSNILNDRNIDVLDVCGKAFVEQHAQLNAPPGHV